MNDASIPTYLTIVDRLFNQLDSLLNNYVYDGYQVMANHLKEPIGLAIVLFIMLLGISIAQGWVRLSMGNLVKSILKITIIYTLAINWSWFSFYIVNFIQGSASEISDWLVNATPIPIPYITGTGVNGALQTVLIEFTKVGSWTWDMGSWHNTGPMFTAVVIWVIGYAIVGLAIFEIAMAKIMLAVLFVLAPLFFAFCIFKSTHTFFDRWLGAIVGYALLLIFVSAVLCLALTLAHWSVANLFLTHVAHIGLVSFAVPLIVGVMCVGIIAKAAHLAKSIGGSACTASGSALVAGMVGGAMSSTMSGGMNAIGMYKSWKKKRDEAKERAAMRAIRSAKDIL